MGYAANTCTNYTSLVKVGLGLEMGCNIVFSEASIHAYLSYCEAYVA